MADMNELYRAYDGPIPEELIIKPASAWTFSRRAMKFHRERAQHFIRAAKLHPMDRERLINNAMFERDCFKRHLRMHIIQMGE